MSNYVDAKEPIGSDHPTANFGCCGEGTGAQAASSAQVSPTISSVVGDIADAGVGAARDAVAAVRGRRGCRCWWVAIAAVVVIALVAKS